VTDFNFHYKEMFENEKDKRSFKTLVQKLIVGCVDFYYLSVISWDFLEDISLWALILRDFKNFPNFFTPLIDLKQGVLKYMQTLSQLYSLNET